MSYQELSKAVEALGYRDKLRLAQLLIQLARKEEEEQNPEKRANTPSVIDNELIIYVAERLKKLKPSKKDTLLNSIGAMFQFQGGISEGDKDKIFTELVKKKHISVSPENKIKYSE